MAVIDLDAALGSGSNSELIKELLSIAPCRVGGGIRSLETAVEWLDQGAEKIILGTKAVPVPQQRGVHELHDQIHARVS